MHLQGTRCVSLLTFFAVEKRKKKMAPRDDRVHLLHSLYDHTDFNDEHTLCAVELGKTSLVGAVGGVSYGVYQNFWYGSAGRLAVQNAMRQGVFGGMLSI